MKKRLWGDFHNNVHTFHMDSIDKLYEFAKEQLDFWPIAYYPFFVDKIGPKEMHAEGLRDEKLTDQNWKDLLQYIKKKPDDFIIIPGYEWQGSGEDGDHNIFFTNEDTAVDKMIHPLRYQELTQELDEENTVMIPHHTGYKVGHRGKNWDTHNEKFSPVMEIYSSHGSSESAISDISLDVHVHMGPRTSEGSAEAGIKRGIKTGFICSGDNHVVPGIAGNGLTAVIADDYSNESIMKALKNRNVYGVTRNKIELDYTINGHIMGSEIEADSEIVEACVDINAGTAIDRVEFFHNGIATNTYVNNGKWEKLAYGDTVKFKFEFELGWGPDQRVFPDLIDKNWDVYIKPLEGKILNYETLFMYPGSKITIANEEEFKANIYTLKTQKVGNHKLSQKNYRTPYIQNQSIIFEMETKTDSQIQFIIDGKEYIYNVKTLLEGTRLEAQLDEVYKLTEERFGVSEYYRSDPFWHNAYKFVIHQAMREESYKISIKEEIQDVKSGDSIFVKVTQKNNDKAWSSPIFIK